MTAKDINGRRNELVPGEPPPIAARLAPLDAEERLALRRCEHTIKRGARAFIEVGLALAEIKAKRLYREQFPSFEAYCRARLDISRIHGYRLIQQASTIVGLQLLPIGNTPLPTTETQARELTRVPAALRLDVLRLAGRLAGGGELTAKLIRRAAVELGATGQNPLMPCNGNDEVQTPPELARQIVAHFMPCGRVLEPCRGAGAFVKAMPGCDWCDLKAGKDFLALKRGHWDWIVSNPPFSRFRDFLRQAMALADNVVFVALAPAWFVNARREDMRGAGFFLVELCELPVPEGWPKFGIELTAGWARRGWRGAIANTRLDGQ